MSMSFVPDDLETEFAEFRSVQEAAPPAQLSSAVLAAIHQQMNPSPFFVFSKIALVVSLVGIMNLTLCPQFGLGFVRHSGLMEFFMSFGAQGCRIACGAFFMGSGLFLVSLFLKPEDILIAKQSLFLQASSLAALSLIVFVACGGEVYFTAALVWFIGSVLGGALSLEIGFFMKRRFILAGIA